MTLAAVKFALLSDRTNDGLPCSRISRDSVRITSYGRKLPPTSIGRHSPVYSSITQSIFGGRPSTNWSCTNWYLYTELGRVTVGRLMSSPLRDVDDVAADC